MRKFRPSEKGLVLKLGAFIGLAFIAITLSGCVTGEDSTAQLDAAVRDKCISYGANPGTPAYTDCRLKLEGVRRQVAAEEASRPLPPPNIPSNCPTGASGISCVGPQR
jgi:hypothetical protein